MPAEQWLINMGFSMADANADMESRVGDAWYIIQIDDDKCDFHKNAPI